MLLNLAKKNVSKNFNSYLIYFASIIFNVIIYYTFESIRYNKQIENFVSEDPKMLMVFKGASIIIAIFSAIFIWYSSSFFIKKRKKEIGIYSLLGLKKRQIGSLLFYENIIMGILALIIGMLIGTLTCKLFIMMLAKFMGMSATIKFSISLKAAISTIKIFGVLFLIASINAYSIIYRFKLIDLFKAESVSEKEPKASKVLAIISILMLGVGYGAAVTIHDSPSFMLNFPIAVVCCIVGTFIFFRAFLIYTLKILKKKKNLYYKGQNMISISNLLYRIKANSRTLSIIALLNAVTITSIGFGYGLYYQGKEVNKISMPYSYSYISTDNKLDEKIYEAIQKHKENKLLYSQEANLVKVNGKIEKSENLDFKFEDKNIYLISESQFKTIAEKRGIKENLNLYNSKDAIVLRYGGAEINKLKGRNIEINVGNLNDKLKMVDRKEYDAMNAFQVGLTLLVKDEVYNKYKANNIVTIKAYKIDKELDSKALSKEFIKLLPVEAKLQYAYSNALVNAVISMICFIGVFLGLIFLAATGSIIYFKQLTEANEDKERYKILRKIGVNGKEVKKCIKKQVFVIFASPLAIALTHSLAVFTFMATIGNKIILIPACATIIFYVVLYSIYYILTVNSYYKIVMSK